MAEQIKQSENSIEIVGTVKEINMSPAGIEKRVLNKKKGIEVDCNLLKKTEFKNPAFTVTVNGKDIPIEISRFGIKEKKVGKDDAVVDNALYTSLVNLKKGERVVVKGTLAPNEYPNKDGEWKEYNANIEATFAVSTSNVPDEDSAKGLISGVVAGISDEVVNEEETGRKKVRIATFDWAGNISFVNLFAPSEDGIADAIGQIYDSNDSVKIYFDADMVQHGKVETQTTAAFGKKVSTTSGYTTLEYLICGGEEPYDEESEYHVFPQQVAEAMEAKKVYIADQCAAAIERAQGGSSSTVKGASAGQGSNPFGENPFGSNPFA